MNIKVTYLTGVIELPKVYYLLIRKSKRTWLGVKSKYYILSNYAKMGPFDTYDEVEEILQIANKY